MLDVCALDVEHALPWCACLALRTLSTSVEAAGGLNVLFLDSFGSYTTGVEPVLREILRMRLLALRHPSQQKSMKSVNRKRGRRSSTRTTDTTTTKGVFLCFASSHRGESNAESWRRRVANRLRHLMREYGYTDSVVQPFALPPSQIRAYHSMLFHAFWIQNKEESMLPMVPNDEGPLAKKKCKQSVCKQQACLSD